MDRLPTERGLLRVGLLLLGAFLAWRFLAGVVASVLLLSVGLLLAVALSGAVEALHRRKVPRPLATAAIALAVAALVCLGGYLLSPVSVEQARALALALPGAVSELAERLEEVAGGLGVQIGNLEAPSASTLGDWGRQLLGGALGLFGSLTSALLGLVVALFVPLYLAAMPSPVVDWAVRLFPPGRRPRTREVLSEARASLLSWLGGQLVSMATVGVLSTAALYLIGIPGALFLGIFTGLIAFVPLVGAVVSVVPPLLLALAGNPIDALWVLLAYVAIQQAEGNLLTPLVMRRAASMHPAVVIAAVVIFGGAFGILGALLAVPACVVGGVMVSELWFRRLEKEEGGPFGEPGERPEGAAPEDEERIRRAVLSFPEVTDVPRLLATRPGPDGGVLVSAEIRLVDGLDADRVEDLLERVGRRVRAEAPEVRQTFIEPHAAPRRSR